MLDPTTHKPTVTTSNTNTTATAYQFPGHVAGEPYSLTRPHG